MPPQPLSLSRKLSAFLARKIVWLWPQETKEWALAFEAELPEIPTPFASARWVLGGATLLARESLRHFLKSLWRPLGVAAPSDPSAFTGNGGPAPRLPRFFAALFLFASLAMLCLPEVRAVLSSSVLFGQTTIHQYFHERNIQNLRAKARASHDPQLIAFLSLALYYDPERRQLADEAIRRDPSLTWIDYAESYWNDADPDRSHFLSDERIARLQRFDPRNAATWLLTAEVISHTVEQAYRVRTQGISFTLLFFAYRPYAFQNVESREDLITAAAVAQELPRTIGLFVFDSFYVHGRYYFWLGLTGVLSLMVFFLVYRMVPKRHNS